MECSRTIYSDKGSIQSMFSIGCKAQLAEMTPEYCHFGVTSVTAPLKS